MAIALSGQNIVVSGAASHTLDEAVGLGSTSMTTHSFSNGRPIYRYTGTITIQTGATFTIKDFVFESLRIDRLSADQSGQIVVQTGGILNIENTTVVLSSYDCNGGISTDARFRIKREGTGQINYVNSIIEFNTPASIVAGISPRIEIQATSAINSQFIRGFTAAGVSDNCAVLIWNGNGYSNITLIDVMLDILEDAALSNASGLALVQSRYAGTSGFINWVVVGLVVRDIAVTGNWTHDYYSATDFYNVFIDCDIDLANGQVMVQALPFANEHRKGWSVTYKVLDSTGPIENALIVFDGETDISVATDSSGLHASFDLITQKTQLVGAATPGGAFSYTVFSKPLAIFDASSYQRQIKSYGHLAVADTVSVTARIGSAADPLSLVLIPDEGVTVTNTATVGGYSGITNATALITLSGTLTLSQVYDSRKLYWRNNDSIAVPTKDGVAADFGTAAITISAPANLPATTAKYTQFTTAGIVTLSAAGNYSGGSAGVIPATGEVQVTDGTSDLAGWAFASGAEVNLRSGQTAAIVQVDQPQIANITPGAGVTLVSSPVSFTGFPTGNNANGVAYAAVIAILNTDDDVLLAEYTGGATYSVSLSEVGNGVGPFEVWGDGVGLRRTIAQTITATRSEPVSLAGLFEEFRSEDGTALIGLAAADSDVVYVTLDTNFEFDGPTHSFLGIVHQFDLLTSTPAGQDFDNTAVRGIEFISNDAYRRIFLPAPFTISASATAVGIPMITDCLVLRTTTLADVRVTPIVQFAFQAEGSGGGLTAQQVRDALKLAPSAGSPAAGSVDADLDAILLDTDVTIPAQITERTLDSDAYFDPAADTVANVTTVATVTTLTNLPTIPTNWITAAGVATDAIGADELAASAVTEIQNGLATTTQLNAIQGATFDPTTDSLEALSVRVETIDKEGTKVLRRRD